MSSCPLEISNLPSGLSQVSSPDVVGVAGSNSHPAFRQASSSFVLAHHSPRRLCTPLPSHQPILSWSRHPTSSRRTLERNFDTSQGGGNNPRGGRETGPLSFQILCPTPPLLSLCALSRGTLDSTGLLRIHPRTKTHLRGPSCARLGTGGRFWKVSQKDQLCQAVDWLSVTSPISVTEPIYRTRNCSCPQLPPGLYIARVSTAPTGS